MPKDIILQALSAGMGEAIVSRWLIEAGDPVAPGDAIAEVETDKATMEIEAEAAGTLGRILVPNGGTARTGEVIAILLIEGESNDDVAPVSAAAVEAPAPETSAAPVPATAGRAGRIKASPLARRIAREAGLSLDGFIGSGPQGRIVRIDVERALQVPPPVADALATPSMEPSLAPLALGSTHVGPHEARPHSSMRRTIARRLTESKSTVPHFYLDAECRMEALLDLRAQLNAARPENKRISVNDFILKAAGTAMAQVPEANVIWTEDALLHLTSIDISVAVATDGGLITPVVRNVGARSIGAISDEMKTLATRARDGKLDPAEYRGGSISVSNLGMFGTRKFAAILNPPQSAIIAVGTAEARPVGEDGRIVLATVMSVTLSVDHRAVDGAVAARWLAAFKAAIEAPMTMLA